MPMGYDLAFCSVFLRKCQSNLIVHQCFRTVFAFCNAMLNLALRLGQGETVSLQEPSITEIKGKIRNAVDILLKPLSVGAASLIDSVCPLYIFSISVYSSFLTPGLSTALLS